MLGTLLHEAAHGVATTRGIKDTSRQGRYHNRKFAELAEELGITVALDGARGWSATTLPYGTGSVDSGSTPASATTMIHGGEGNGYK
ncbi:hypothetical protein [Pseudonocardia nigra]|uniref:hypothetical protein n=1 Tax=Pseudonocardia nigra TaxID=1921578 RepID=UPI001C5DD847|nr:hypothetical protein [Pseudonocardia nigra]